MSETFDAVVVGAGIVGAATAAELAARRPAWRIAVLEKEEGPARHQTGRNSGVIHSGVYYTPGGLKARLCREGLERTYAFCAARNIPAEKRGKLLVATDAEEEERLGALEARAAENGVAVERLDQAGLRAAEPAVSGVGALRVPATGIVDYVAITRALLADVENAGGAVRYRAPVTALRRAGAGFSLTAGGAEIEAGRVIGCGGLTSDRLARLAGLKIGVRIVPFRGEYYVLPAARGQLVSHLIYPVPNPALPFLGVHLTPMIDGTITIGPNAVLALAREKYGKFSVAARDAAEALLYSGLWRAIARHPRATWNELAGSLSRRRYLAEAQKYCAALTMADLAAYRSGVRAQAVRPNGALVDDFLIEGDAGLTMVLNAPSPAATSALPIARSLADRVLDAAPA